MIAAPRLVLAAASSGAGKTTVACGLIAALRRRGVAVAPFKVGPDYLDPAYLSVAAGVPARNLDGWLLSPEALREVFQRAVTTVEVAVIEGVMGLYDGRADQPTGSTAALAKELAAPVIVVLDVTRASRTNAAVLLGLQRFDPGVTIAGVILNGIASERHLAWTAGPIQAATGIPVLGHLRREQGVAFSERHLGLVLPVDAPPTDQLERLAEQVENNVDLDAILAIARNADPLRTGDAGLFPAEPSRVRTRIAVARDAAFGFYYEDNLDLLAAWGAELVPFSPLAGSALPEDVGGVYFGGGYPELHAEQLAANEGMLASVRAAAARGLPIYAECGGLMYLCEELRGFEDQSHAMVGVIPDRSVLDQPRAILGYRTALARQDSLLTRAGQAIRGHEFHWSRRTIGAVTETAAYDLDAPPGLEGYARDNVLASYVHVHFGTDAGIAPRFVDLCAR